MIRLEGSRPLGCECLQRSCRRVSNERKGCLKNSLFERPKCQSFLRHGREADSSNVTGEQKHNDGKDACGCKRICLNCSDAADFFCCNAYYITNQILCNIFFHDARAPVKRRRVFLMLTA